MENQNLGGFERIEINRLQNIINIENSKDYKHLNINRRTDKENKTLDKKTGSLRRACKILNKNDKKKMEKEQIEKLLKISLGLKDKIKQIEFKKL